MNNKEMIKYFYETVVTENLLVKYAASYHRTACLR